MRVLDLGYEGFHLGVTISYILIPYVLKFFVVLGAHMCPQSLLNSIDSVVF